jgi:magnesium-transporting ATPase (P-type)
MASSIIGPEVKTSFDKGMQRFTVLMIQFILVMVPLVFLINGFTKRNWGEAFFFSIAVAVGLTPEMLPMIVSVCLSNGALAMSKGAPESVFPRCGFFELEGEIRPMEPILIGDLMELCYVVLTQLVKMWLMRRPWL